MVVPKAALTKDYYPVSDATSAKEGPGFWVVSNVRLYFSLLFFWNATNFVAESLPREPGRSICDESSYT